jgi:hypothetical protein
MTTHLPFLACRVIFVRNLPFSISSEEVGAILADVFLTNTPEQTP